MPAQPVEVVRQRGAGIVRVKEPLGGVFAPVPGKMLRPVYTLGPKDSGGAVQRDLMFTCPVAAIPNEIWDLLHLWNCSRLMNLPPVSGGFLDQPHMVQLSFPIFEALMRATESGRQQQGTAMLLAGSLAAMFGKGKGA